MQGQAYRQEYGFNAIHLLPVNLYGPHDNFDPKSSHVIPALIRKCVEAAETGAPEVVCWGTGNATREFLFVEDCAEGDRARDGALRRSRTGQSRRRLRDRHPRSRRADRRADRIHGEAGVRSHASRTGSRGACSTSRRAEKRFGFKATTDFRAGLRRTIDWYRAQREALV